MARESRTQKEDSFQLNEDGEIVENHPKSGFLPLRLIQELNQRHKEKVKREEEEELLRQQQEDWEKRIEVILINPIKTGLSDLMRKSISSVFESHKQINRGWLYERSYEQMSWWNSLSATIGPEFLASFNKLLQPDRKKLEAMLTEDEVKSSSVIPPLIEKQYKQIERMGYSRDAETLGISYEEILEIAQEHLVNWYNNSISSLNEHYYCAYGIARVKRKRS